MIKIKILWLSNSPHVTSGYGLQTKYIGNYLNQHHEFYILGLQTPGGPITYQGIKVLPIFEDTWAKKALPFWLARIQPDVWFSLCDIWVKPQLAELGKRYAWVPYLPVDTEPLPRRSNQILSEATFIIPFSKFAEDMIRDEGFSNCERIPHGIDTEVYRPLDEERVNDAKRQLGADLNVDLEDKFIILCVGMNKGFRKGFGRLMQSFRKLKDDYKDIKLWLHTDPQSNNGMPLEHYVKNFGLKEGRDVIFSPACGVGRPWSMEKMNELYNMADIHALATMGEGFGLPIAEAQAAEVPSVMTDFSTANELIGNDERGIKVDTATLWTTPLATNQGLIDIDKMYGAFKEYYENRDLIKKHGKAGRKNVAKKYSWEKVLPQWNPVLKDIKRLL